MTKPEPSYAPIYAAALYPELAKIARKHGYALAVHGSLQRDFDLIGIPWVDKPSDPQAVVDEICSGFDVRQIGQPGEKTHGRRAWTISVGHGCCALDLSFMPVVVQQELGCNACIGGVAMTMLTENNRPTDFVSVPRGLLMEVDQLLANLRHQVYDCESTKDLIDGYQDQLREAYTQPGFRQVRGQS